jgi:HD-like signal output (HDOD) protein
MVCKIANIEDEVLKRVNTLSPLQDTILKIQEVVFDPNSAAQDLVTIVEKDPVLTAKILKIANSPYYGFTSKITSVEHAIALFGMDSVLGFALSLAVNSNFKNINLKPYNISVEDFAKSSFRQNKLMITWHFYIKLPKSFELIPASFINEIGKIILAQIVIENNLTAEFSEAIKNNVDYFEVEKEFLGITTPEVTAKILYKWRLNVNMVYSILSSIDPSLAEEPLRTFGFAIKAVRDCMGPKGIITKNSVLKALDSVVKAGLKKKDFINSLKRAFQDEL